MPITFGGTEPPRNSCSYATGIARSIQELGLGCRRVKLRRPFPLPASTLQGCSTLEPSQKTKRRAAFEKQEGKEDSRA